MHAHLYDFKVMAPDVKKGGGGGGGGEGVPAGTLNLENVFDILANALKLQEFFINLSGKNLM